MRAGLIQATAPSAAAPAAPHALQIVEIAVHALHGLSDGLDGGVDGGARGLNLLAVDLILWHVPVLSMMIGVFLHAIAVGATGRYSGCYVISERVQRKKRSCGRRTYAFGFRRRVAKRRQNGKRLEYRDLHVAGERAGFVFDAVDNSAGPCG